MWLMLNDCFLSFVSKDCADDELMVRARRPGDIEKLFPDAKVTKYTKSDYLFGAPVKKDAVRAALVAEVDRIVYNNFKNSVRDHALHDAYSSVWSTMADLQPLPPYSGNMPSRSILDSDWWRDRDDAFSSGMVPMHQQKQKAPDIQKALQLGFDTSPTHSRITKSKKKAPKK